MHLPNVPMAKRALLALGLLLLPILASAQGTVVAWGWNGEGETNVPAGLSGVIAVDAGSYHNLAIKSDHTVVAWGSNEYGQSMVPANLAGVVAVEAAFHHSLALTAGGTVVCWGSNE
jgi:alpha-tubulin suppressor-like RCC1 family protein